MKWFDKWFRKKCKEALEYPPEPEKYDSQAISTIASVSRSLRHHGNNEDSLNFQIYFANGGYVLEYSHYDNKKDEHTRRLHIVRSDENLGEDISKVITMEMLRK